MFTSVESGKPPSPPTYVYIVNTPTRNSATDRYYIISRTAITIYSSTIMKFPSLSIENSNIPKTNCLPITRRRKEKRTIYFHLRFDVSLNDAIDPTGERGGGEGSVDPRRRGGEARSDGKRADSFMAGQMERFERAVSHECESLAMRVVWKRKSSGDRDDSLFEARSPDVPSFSGIPQDVHVCPTPVEGSASCRHRASKDRRKLCANRAQVSSRPEGCPCSRWNFVDEFGG